MAVQIITVLVELVSPTGSTVASLKPTELTWTQDESGAPMFTGRTTVAKPTAAQFAMLRPGSGYFLRVGGWPDVQTEQTYLFKITDRTLTPDGLVELQFGGPELELQSYTPSVVDRSAWGRQSNVSWIVASVLDTVWDINWGRFTYGDTAFGEDIGAPTYITYQAVTNMLPDGGFEYGTSGYTAVNSTISRTTAVKHSGTYAMTMTGGAGGGTPRAEVASNLAPGTTYTLSGWFRQSAAMPASAPVDSRKITVAASINGVQYTLFRSDQFPNTANTWFQFRFTFTMPPLADAGSVILRFVHGPTSTQSTVTTYWDDLLLVEGDGLDTDGVSPIPFFSGNTTDGTAGYNYDWQGDPGGSASTRTPILARDPESLTWSPGQSAWDFLQPILQATGWHLWADSYDTELVPGAVSARMFWAKNEFGFKSAARNVFQGFNLLDLSQVDSWSSEFSDGTPMYADQVILHYTWNDSQNQPQEAYDVYPATGKKPYFKELPDTPFAGVGRAQGIYNRISARATMLQGTAWFERGIFPGQQIAVTADAIGGSAVGYVEATTHDPFRGTTEFRTKQTVAYTAASWFAATGSWASQTGSWAAATT